MKIKTKPLSHDDIIGAIYVIEVAMVFHSDKLHKMRQDLMELYTDRQLIAELAQHPDKSLARVVIQEFYTKSGISKHVKL